MMRWLLTILAALSVLVASTTSVHAQERLIRVLYLSQSVGWVHDTVRRPPAGLASSEIAMQAMARDSGTFSVELTQDARDITPETLQGIDVLVFSTTGALPIDRQTWNAITAWIESGKGGFVGIHSAADTALAFDGGDLAYSDFLGGVFDGHPWTQGTPIRLTNLEPDHPLAAMWPDSTDYAEEIYQYARFDPSRVRVLQALDMGTGPVRRPYPVPVTWVREIGQGRLFFTNLGHTPSTWDDPRFGSQIETAIRWAAHRIDAPASPNPQDQDRLALTTFQAVEGPVSPSLAAAEAATAIRALQPLFADDADVDARTAAISKIRGRDNK